MNPNSKWNKKTQWQRWLKQQSRRWPNSRLTFLLSVLSKAIFSKRGQRYLLVAIALVTFIAATSQSAISANSSTLSNLSALSARELHENAEVSSTQLFLTDNQSASLLAQGQRQYSAGQLAAALQTWQTAAEQADDQLAEATILSYVSIAAQDLGEWTLAAEAIARSQSLLSDKPLGSNIAQVKAQVLNAQGRLALKQGQPERAWEIWQQAAAAYKRANDSLGQVGAQINQSQALQTMGLYRRASLQLEEVAAGLETQPDSMLKAIAFKSLGDVFNLAGDLKRSEQYLSKSLALYQQLGTDGDVAATLFSLANTLRLMGNPAGAEQKYRAAEALVPQSALHTKAQLNRFSLLLETEQWQSARQLLPGLFTQVENLPPSRQAVYARVNLIESLMTKQDETHQPMDWLSVDAIASLLKSGIQQASTLNDSRAESFATGELSKLYGYTEQWSDSAQLAQRALTLAQGSSARDIAYRWQQQLGKAYSWQGKTEQAIESYTAAVETLREVRRDLLATNSDVQFSFRETVEPVYRELVSLLLLPEDASQKSLSQARNVTEELQLAELENYFRSACVDSATESIDKLDDQAAVLYPIILKDRVEVILSTPGSPLRHYRTWQNEQTTNQTIGGLYRYLNPILSEERRLDFAKQLYDWLITPAEAALKEKDIQTLVFVLDGQFRRIPMAALYDGEHYLLENYSVALTPGLRLLGPHFQNPKPLQALMLGLTEARGGFSALPGVKTEIEQISERVNTEVIFNEDFTKEKLAAEIERISFPVLHLATHGQFSSDLAETFLLAWDERILVGDLDELLRSRRERSEPIELMVLSACETAEGDDRAALGLAGMAIRSGARSTLATLWSVNDSSTAALMTEFYQELATADLTKAEALRRAQIKILQNPQYSHPYYWAAFVLIGNWLS